MVTSNSPQLVDDHTPCYIVIVRQLRIVLYTQLIRTSVAIYPKNIIPRNSGSLEFKIPIAILFVDLHNL
jgi:hypothetical protein